jgi:hypothetical protein
MTAFPLFLLKKEIAPLVLDDAAELLPAELQMLGMGHAVWIGFAPQFVVEAPLDQITEPVPFVLRKVEAQLLEDFIRRIGRARALVATLRAFIRKAGIGWVVVYCIDATANVIDDLIEACCDWLVGGGATEITSVALGVMGAKFLQPLIAETLSADELRMAMRMHGRFSG